MKSTSVTPELSTNMVIISLILTCQLLVCAHGDTLATKAQRCPLEAKDYNVSSLSCSTGAFIERFGFFAYAIETHYILFRPVRTKITLNQQCLKKKRLWSHKNANKIVNELNWKIFKYIYINTFEENIPLACEGEVRATNLSPLHLHLQEFGRLFQRQHFSPTVINHGCSSATLVVLGLYTPVLCKDDFSLGEPVHRKKITVKSVQFKSS